MKPLIIYHQLVRCLFVKIPVDFNRKISAAVMFGCCLLFSPALWAAQIAAPHSEHEPPRVRALLEEAWELEQYSRSKQHQILAAALYCEAARFGSAEGHFRAALIHLRGAAENRNLIHAKSFLYYAQELGHPSAERYLSEVSEVAIKVPECLTQAEAYRSLQKLDFTAHLEHLSKDRRKIANLVARLAPEYGIDPELALAIAAAESNFNPKALSPKNATGVMQLIPATAERFGVQDIWDIEQNIRGGLAYLRWLMRRFANNTELAVAAYNAGEGNIDRYQGVPPFYETRSYVFRVLNNSRMLQPGSGRKGD